MTAAIQSDLPSTQTPGLMRRLASFVYEGVLLFGVVMIFGLIFATLTKQQNAMVGRHGLQAFLFVVLGIYFIWFWVHGGQTVAMKAWHLRLVDSAGQPVLPWRALARYFAAWLWVLPAPALMYVSGVHSEAALFGGMFIGVVAYAALARIHPQRQFVHDVLCGTRLVVALPPAKARRG